MNVEHKKIEKIFKDIIKKASYIDNSVVVVKGVRPIASLTDWKELYFNKNLKPGKRAWFIKLSSMDDIDKLRDEYLLLLDLANEWFEQCKNLDYVYNHNLTMCSTYSVQMALSVGSYSGRNIKKDLIELFKNKKDWKGWNKNEVELFFEKLIIYTVEV